MMHTGTLCSAQRDMGDRVIFALLPFSFSACFRIGEFSLTVEPYNHMLLAALRQIARL